MRQRSDVVIAGGGLAGLTLALQIRKQLPTISITVLERHSHPAPIAAHKVGESTVELGAYYFAEVIGCRPHLKDCQLPKLGIRVFVPNQPAAPLEERLEIGSSRYLPTSTFQIDRGKFENFLGEECLKENINFICDSQVRQIQMGKTADDHEITFRRAGEEHTITCRWLVDASGRAALLKKKLGLEAPSTHRINAAWFRLAAKINLDEWSEHPDWRKGHDGMYSRWFSTNHLMGTGYWVWIIPLSSGSTSIGIVADPRHHPLDKFNTFERAMQWLDANEPRCGEAVRQAAHLKQDFIAMKEYSHGCTQLFSGDRWAITGDAGVFIDPLYSPGSDFIGISNTFISDLIRRDFEGEEIQQHARIFNSMYLSLSENTQTVFEDQYALFGNPQVVMLKIAWDYAVYWSFFAFVAIQRQFCNVRLISKVSADLQTVADLNREMQVYLRQLAQNSNGRCPASFIDLSKIEYLFTLNEMLQADLTEDAFAERLSHNIDQLGCFAREIVERTSSKAPALSLPTRIGNFPPTTSFLQQVYPAINL